MASRWWKLSPPKSRWHAVVEGVAIGAAACTFLGIFLQRTFSSRDSLLIGLIVGFLVGALRILIWQPPRSEKLQEE